MLVKFFDPHPGFGGATVPLPTSIKTIIDSFDGKEAELFSLLLALNQEGMTICCAKETEISDLLTLNKESTAICWAELEHRYISCRIVNNGYTHQWRLIRWKDVTDDANID